MVLGVAGTGNRIHFVSGGGRGNMILGEGVRYLFEEGETKYRNWGGGGQSTELNVWNENRHT